MAQNPSEQPQNPPEPSPNLSSPASNTQEQTPTGTPPNPPMMPPVTPVSTPVPPAYPANLTIDYPDRPLNRLTTFFRIFVVLPILTIFILLIGSGYGNTTPTAPGHYTSSSTSIGGVAALFLAIILMLLFRKKYPKWWFDWNFALTKFTNRVGAYILLLRDEYPSTDEEQSVHVFLPYPDATKLSRWLPLVKWFLAIPHVFILVFLGIGAFFVMIIAWFAILFTGRYPRGMFDYVVGVMRWVLRVHAYAILLTTDKYPPFSLEE